MPTKLGKYEIKGELGRGAMGVVYLAQDPRLGRPVALKTMSPNVAGDPDLLKRFYREAQSAGQLRHPNIVTIYDIDEADGFPFIAMELLEGEAVERIIAARKDITVVKKLDIMIQTCRGLHYAHQRGIVHRDVKPANIVLLNDGMVKLVDFGIARVTTTSMTRTGVVMGTPMYMSPEQIQGQAVDARSDIFSVGVILYELLTYQNPFAANDVTAILYNIMNQPPQPITHRVPNCPPQLEEVILRAVAKNREQRYQTAEDMAFDLQNVATSLKRQMLDLYIQEGQRSIEEGNLTLAKESLQKVLEIDSGHDLAKGLLSQVQKQIYARQRAQQIEQFMRQAKEALQAEQFDEAIAALDEFLRLEPEREEAQQYKQLAIERRDRLQKIKRHMERAEKFVADADFKSAKAEVEAVLGLDRKHTAALKMMEYLLKELAEQERLRQVRHHTEAARNYLAGKSFAKAIELLEKARELDPINIEVETLMRLARGGKEQEQRRQLLDQRLADIQELINRENYDQALRVAEQTLQDFPEDSQALKLHTQAARLAEIQKKRRYVDEQLQAAREFVQKNQYAETLALLERALETAPDDPRLAAFLKSVQEAQASAAIEALRRQNIREANELIRRKDFSAAIATLEKALASAGHSPELGVLLQYAREQQEEEQRRERLRQVLNRAQAALRGENFEEAVRVLERAQRELKASEIETLLASAREQAQKFEQRREETLQRSRRLFEAGDAAKAVALLDAAPKAYFKNAEFQAVYARCREAVKRANFIRSAVEQVEKHIASENLAEAEALLQRALQTYPDDPMLLASQKRLREEEDQLRRVEWGKVLDEAKVAMGRMEYREAIQLLSHVPWDSADLPELAAEAQALLQEAQQKERDVYQRQTIVYQPAPKLVTSLAAEPAALLESQKRLKEALGGQLVRPEQPSQPRQPALGARPPEAAPPAAGPSTPAGPAAVPKHVPTPVAPPPSVRPREVLVEALPPPELKQTPAALWAGMGFIALSLLGLAIWRISVGAGGKLGFVQLSSAPWAEVVRVESAEGKSLHSTGQTPIELELPPGKYVIELKNERGVGKVDVVVESGKVSSVNYTFPDVNVNGVVDELVSKY